MAELTVTVRYFAAARAAAGTTEEQLTLPEGTLSASVTVMVARHGAGLERVLQRCSYLVDEVAAHGPSTPLAAGSTVDVLPPFAGG